jgi:hypothetical protein
MSGGQSKSKNQRGPLIYPSLSIAGIAALLTLWLPVVFMRQSENIGGVRYWWLVDDAIFLIMRLSPAQLGRDRIRPPAKQRGAFLVRFDQL